jgi:hypothetical protein
MPCDPLMRWENEGGAVIDEDEGTDPDDRSQAFEEQVATLTQPDATPVSFNRPRLTDLGWWRRGVVVR